MRPPAQQLPPAPPPHCRHHISEHTMTSSQPSNPPGSPSNPHPLGGYASGYRPYSGPPAWQLAIISRLIMVIPMSLGTLGVEIIFVHRAITSGAGGTIAIGAAVITFFLLWVALAWAMRSWVSMLITFIPAVLVTLGGAFLLGYSRTSGTILLIVGLTMVGSIVWFRLARPTRWWNATGLHAPDPRPKNTSYDVSVGPPDRDPRPPISSSPDWDTSATHRRKRDAFVLDMCQRGGTVGSVLVTLEEFFTGNGDPRSIAPTLRGAVPLTRFATVLHSLRARPDVQAVLIQVEPLAEGEYQLGQWPTAGGVHIFGQLSGADIDEHVAGLAAEPAIGPLPVTELPDGTPAGADAAEYALWWD